MVKPHVAIRWAEGYKSTGNMLAKMRSKRRDISPNTMRNYCTYVKLFSTEYMKQTNPDTCLSLLRKEGIADYVDKYLDWLLENRKVALRTARNGFFAVKFWLESNDIDTKPLEKIEMPTTTQSLVIDRAPTKEELKHLRSFMHLRDETVMMIAKDSGLRVGTIGSLKVGDIVLDPRTLYEETTQKDRDHSDMPILIKVQPGIGRKTKRGYFTFATPETKTVLTRYLEWRRRKGEAITEDSALIGSIHDINDDRAKRLPNEPFGSHVDITTLQKNWARILDRAGLNKHSGTWHELHIHTLRKYFKTQCTIADIPQPFIEFWMGHKGVYLDGSYFRANVQEHLTQYLKAMSHLSLEKPTMPTREELRRDMLNLIPDDVFKTLADKQGVSVEQIKNILAKSKSAKQLETEQENNTENHDCQKVIPEADTENYLAQGYRFVAKLNGDKVIVER